MIDLSPQPQDKGGASKAVPSVPQHDLVRPEQGKAEQGKAQDAQSRWRFPHDEGEAAIQRLSRWAGPLALLLTLCLLGWWIIR
ncbi:hypothetical protein [Sphingobium chlorophenolicum]|uniref:hypothetical protein n=1 Tax=Sphingobium chlorophenolicum TaxID=46429 RepID=UPI00031FADBF|nr:hypothetical protein [Sphingobium chlorophenolicum]